MIQGRLVVGTGTQTVPLGLEATGVPHACPYMSGNDMTLQVLLVTSLNTQQNSCQLGTKGQMARWGGSLASLSVSRDKREPTHQGVGACCSPWGRDLIRANSEQPGCGNETQQPFLRMG